MSAKRMDDIIELLTREIDPETEAYLRSRGFWWYFKARRKVLRALAEK